MKFSRSFDRKINRNDNSSPYRRSKSPKSGPHSTEKVRPSLSLILARKLLYAVSSTGLYQAFSGS